MQQNQIIIRDVTGEDLARVLELNEAALPHVNSVDLEFMRWSMESAAHFRVAAGGEGVAAFMIAHGPGVSYDSLNYQWFLKNYAAFMYVDRIVVAEEARGCGLGTRLYEDIFRAAAGTGAPVTCEVNTRPRNELSLAFHSRLGFRQVGAQDTEGGKKSVALLARDAG